MPRGWAVARCYNVDSNVTESVAYMTRSRHEDASWETLLTGLLPQVSRSFYLTIRVLPYDLRRPVGLAYLLARAADTIATPERCLPPSVLIVCLAFARSWMDRPLQKRSQRLPTT